jgi:hypothetical protein
MWNTDRTQALLETCMVLPHRRLCRDGLCCPACLYTRCGGHCFIRYCMLCPSERHGNVQASIGLQVLPAQDDSEESPSAGVWEPWFVCGTLGAGLSRLNMRSGGPAYMTGYRWALSPAAPRLSR